LDGRSFHFKLTGFLRSAPKDAVPFLEMLSETQAFNEFIMERCLKPANDPEVALFDQIIMAKRNRGRHGLFGKQGIFLMIIFLISGTPLLITSFVNLETRKTISANDTKLPPLYQLPNTPPPKLDSTILLPPRLAQPRPKFSRERGFVRRKPVNKSDETITSSHGKGKI
jgi:dDENN domain